MKWIVAPVFIFLIMTQAFSKWIVITEFNMYRNYIAKNLCENRYRPQLHCNGKCVLMKKMAAEENQSAPPGTIKLNWETSLFIDNHPEFPGKPIPAIIKRFMPDESFSRSDSFIPDIFRPPLGNGIQFL
jgi:hypothetical protein